jgi:hypothetical protein
MKFSVRAPGQTKIASAIDRCCFQENFHRFLASNSPMEYSSTLARAPERFDFRINTAGHPNAVPISRADGAHQFANRCSILPMICSTESEGRMAIRPAAARNPPASP